MVKTRIGGILDLSTVDYPGRPAAVVFFYGCNFRCPFCFNKDLLDGKYQELENVDIIKRLFDTKDFIDSIVITGGEPTLQPESLLELCDMLKVIGFFVKIDTNGSNPDVIKELIKKKLVDFIALDVKAPFSKYNAVIGNDFGGKVKETFDIVINSGIKYECRSPLVPGLNDGFLEEYASDVSDAKVFVLEQLMPEKALDPKVRNITPFTRVQMIEKAKAFRNSLVKIRTRENGEELVRH